VPKKNNIINNLIPESIHTIEELINALFTVSKDNYGQVFRKIDLQAEDFKVYSSWSKESYTRNYIVENEAFELILICWEEDQVTAIHDHGGEECWVYSIEGEFKEAIYTESDGGELLEFSNKTIGTGSITYMIDFMGFHSIKNCSKQRGMTLHLYAKPIKTCQVFDPTTFSLVQKDLKYDTSQGVSLN